MVADNTPRQTMDCKATELQTIIDKRRMFWTLAFCSIRSLMTLQHCKNVIQSIYEFEESVHTSCAWVLALRQLEIANNN